MRISRRFFLKNSIIGSVCSVGALTLPVHADEKKSKVQPNSKGCLVDLTECIGCRKCEQACNQVNKLPEPNERFDDLRILHKTRQPDISHFTVVNSHYTGRKDSRNQLSPTYVKVQCMHCLEPACVSVCPVGAMIKKDNGAVVYDESRCIGCRYCMVACPFQIPAYEYHKALDPRVRKCSFCYERINKDKGKPGCAAICPVEAITFGERSWLLDFARKKIKGDPGRYYTKIYGEFEVGGTSWLYISGEPFEKLGFLTLPEKSIPELTESIQHTLFKNFWSPLALGGVMGTMMWLFNRKRQNIKDSEVETGEIDG
jgi:formate dehydrogenase iron-sulfur subunit